ncbi:MAG: squalene/phytoene synthase family protein [Gammaproteobacteria bacterium]|nr:squalene/phytoene synthase family protein [Gammaproteobacteria bacterium]
MTPVETDTDTAAYFETAAAPPGSGLYYACLFTEPRYRPQILALHTLENELVKSLTSIQDPGVARLRLEWWCEEIQRAGNAEARHPLGRELQPYILDGVPDARSLIDAIQALESELLVTDADDFSQLQQQYRDHFGPLWRLSAACCGVTGDAALASAARLGGLHHMSRALQDLSRSLQQGRCRPLPRGELDAAGLVPETLAAATNRNDILASQVRRLRRTLDEAWHDYPPDLAPPFLHGLILCRLDAVLLEEIEQDGARLLEQSYSLTPLRRLWLAWRTRRRVLKRAR